MYYLCDLRFEIVFALRAGHPVQSSLHGEPYDALRQERVIERLYHTVARARLAAFFKQILVVELRYHYK